MQSDNDKTESFVPLTKGIRVGRYTIIEKIGAGGMGEVWLAEDTELDRKVALKFLAPHLCRDEECRRRFKREAQAAAKLNHPNIITIHEVGEYQNRPFFAMEYVEGQSLRDLIKERMLELSQVVDLTVQICEGLQRAHQEEIIHRDVKPSNIHIDNEGRVKILDFGLAMVKGTEKLTKTGSTLGTVGYMSPEQIKAETVDNRSDLFSLGVILYEMIAGQAPFKEEYEAATFNAILNDTPEPLARYRAEVPDELQRVVSKLLEKNPGFRYQSAAEIISDLRRFSREKVEAVRPHKDWWNRYVVVGAVVVLAIIAIYYMVINPLTGPAPVDKSERKMLAVLPFENLGDPEDEYFADGMTDEIISRLASLHELGVISRTSTLQYKGTSKNLRQIGEELGADYILEGTIRWDKTGQESRVRINPQLIRVTDDIHLWADRYDAVIDDIFEVQSTIAEKVIEALDITLLESERQVLSEQPTDNTVAYDYYLRGMQYFDKHSVKDYVNAEAMFLKAIELEPDFVLAHAWLSVVHTQIYSWYIERTDERKTAAQEAVERALEIAPDNIDALAALAWYHFSCLEDHNRALEEFKILRKREPNDYTFHFCIAIIERSKGQWQEAVADFKKALELNPRSANLWSELGVTLIYLRDYAGAEAAINRSLELEPDFRIANHNKVWLYLIWKGDVDAARQALQETLNRIDRWSGLTYLEALMDIIEADYSHGLTLLTELVETGQLASYDSATCFIYKGDIYQLLNQIEKKHICLDSARVILERLVLEEPDNPSYRADLGLTYAGLGRRRDAIREGKMAVEMMAGDGSAIMEALALGNLANIYANTGEYDLACEQLDYLLSIPSDVSIPFLKIDPDFAPLRDQPCFQALIEKYEKKDAV